ncbi:TetR/AcrR family transcriptional regulator [Marinimicrococcus flavescens]|uniref:TetR/AcrR family transcriptional regulator n=1 Tax=Marinimicrococcus flavescens TaxID=3031815 RepID=A0AAP3UY47_9PROT|nr:TetR/AcrR family transcriptional regulator [Marinimicrococcus flavescens]
MTARTPRRGSRDRSRTEAEIVAALEAMIREEGVHKVGVNRLAQRAGCGKELIYRYFGGLDGVFLALMAGVDYWTRSGDIPLRALDGGQPPAAAILDMLKGQLATLRGDELVQEIRRWELVEADGTREKLAKRRERLARSFIERASEGAGADVDVPAVTGLLLAGVLYLVLRSRTEDHFLGVPLQDEAGWQRYENALEHVCRRIFPESMQPPSGGSGIP